ncbi:AMP-binding protein [Nocardia cyriacigeorgica]|uniref:AMP-binding protein n=1 Tax=Nocardia cyriacigeorgica TaxID=135487 RepID=UPI003EE09E74
MSLWGYFMPLRAGARLVVATPDGHRDPAYVAETIAAQQVTVTDFVPSMLTVFAAHTRPARCRRCVRCSSSVRRCRRRRWRRCARCARLCTTCTAPPSRGLGDSGPPPDHRTHGADRPAAVEYPRVRAGFAIAPGAARCRR